MKIENFDELSLSFKIDTFCKSLHDNKDSLAVFHENLRNMLGILFEEISGLKIRLENLEGKFK